MKIMNKLFFFLFFSLPVISSGYNFSFEKIIGLPANLQKNSKDNAKWQLGATTELDQFCVNNRSKTDHTFDFIHKTAACIQTVASQYQTLFFNGQFVFVPHQFACKDKPLCFGVSKNIIFTLKKGWKFSFIEIPSSETDGYYARGLKEIEVTFNENQKEIIKQWADNNKSEVSCYVSNDDGEFYLNCDDQFYSLTIKKKSTEREPIEISKKQDTSKKPIDTNTKPSNFSTLKKLGVIGFVCVGIVFLIYFNSRIKNFFK
jgi:hypothetical protein